MRRALADSAFWIARRDRDDPRHEVAGDIAHWLVRQRYVLFVTPFIFGETQAYFARQPELSEFVIQDLWENSAVQIVQPSYDDQVEAVTLLRRFRDKSYSFVDALSFIVMRRLELNTAVTFDRHFRQFGEFAIIDNVPA